MKKFLLNIWFLSLFFIPLILWILPPDFFDDGVSICPSKVFLNIECLGCGITRAVMHFHHFEFAEAIYYNWGVIWVYPFLVFLWIKWVQVSHKYSSWTTNLFRNVSKHENQRY